MVIETFLRLIALVAASAAAWFDLRTQRVPYVLMHGILAAGVVAAALSGRWLVVAAAVVAAGGSTLPLPRRVRLAGAFAFGGVFAGLSWRSIDATAAVLVIFGAWLLWEFHLWGGADATIAVGLAAMFPALGFVRLLLVVLACGSLVMLVARHRARTPLARGAEPLDNVS